MIENLSFNSSLFSIFTLEFFAIIFDAIIAIGAVIGVFYSIRSNKLTKKAILNSEETLKLMQTQIQLDRLPLLSLDISCDSLYFVDKIIQGEDFPLTSKLLIKNSGLGAAQNVKLQFHIDYKKRNGWQHLEIFDQYYQIKYETPNGTILSRTFNISKPEILIASISSGSNFQLTDNFISSALEYSVLRFAFPNNGSKIDYTGLNIIATFDYNDIFGNKCISKQEIELQISPVSELSYLVDGTSVNNMRFSVEFRDVYLKHESNIIKKINNLNNNT